MRPAFSGPRASWRLAGLQVHGYPVLVFLLGAVGLPVPASPISTVADALIAEGELDPLPALVVALGACVLGDLPATPSGASAGANWLADTAA